MLNIQSQNKGSFFSRLRRTYAEAFAGLPREVWFLALVMFINRSGSMVLPFLTLYVKAELGFSEQFAGLVVAWFGIGSCLGSVLGGWATHRFGSLRVQTSAFLANGIGFLILAQLSDYVWFSLVLFGMSVAGEAFRPANAAAIADYAPAHLHPRAFALNRLAVNLGFSIGPPLGGLLASYSYFWLFQIDALTCLAAGMVLVLLFRNRPRLVPARTQTDSPANHRSPWLDRNFLLFLLLTLASFGVFFQLVSTYPMYLVDEYNLREWQVGILLGLNTLGVVACEMVLVNQLHGWSKIGLIAWGNSLMCLGMSALVFGQGFWFAAAAVGVWTFGEMLAMPQSLAFVAAYSGRQNRARYMGAYTTCVSASFVLAAAVGAWCYARNHDLIWYVGLGVGIILPPLFGLVRERTDRPPSPPDH